MKRKVTLTITSLLSIRVTFPTLRIMITMRATAAAEDFDEAPHNTV